MRLYVCVVHALSVCVYANLCLVTKYVLPNDAVSEGIFYKDHIGSYCSENLKNFNCTL